MKDIFWGRPGDRPVVAPSILSADFAAFAEGIERVRPSGVRALHLDVMDGHFVPNLTFGPPLVEAIRRRTDLFLDCHLMIEEPLRYAETFARAGADLLSIHAELFASLEKAVHAVRALDVRVGVALNPDTPLDRVEPVLDRLDLVVVMSVFPGFGGQAFRPEALEKIETLDRIRDERSLSFGIEVDGGVSAENARDLARRGADVLVAGSAVFGAEDPAGAARAIAEAAGA